MIGLQTEQRLQATPAPATTAAAKGNGTARDIPALQIGVLETGCRLWHWTSLQLTLVAQRTACPIPPLALAGAVAGVRAFMALRLSIAPPDELPLELRTAVVEHCLTGHARLWQAQKSKGRTTLAASGTVFADTLHPEQTRSILATVTDRPAEQLLADQAHPFRDVLAVTGFGFFFELQTRGVPWRTQFYSSHLNSPTELHTLAFPVPQPGTRPLPVCRVAHLLGQWCVLTETTVVWLRSGEEAVAAWTTLFVHRLHSDALDAQFQVRSCRAVTDTILEAQSEAQRTAGKEWALKLPA